MSQANPNVRVHELLDYLRNGRIMDAMREFYADDVVMEEPAYGKTEGLAANLAREEQFVDSGKPVHVEQVAVARWRDGKIVHERFYYNMG